MDTLYLLHYNNYYNRIVKQEQNLSDYMNYLVKSNGQSTDANGNTAVIENVNFVENDFVNTTQVVNWGGDLPDYILVVDENQNLKGRWFVVDTVKTRNGQLQLTLHRDVIVDNYESILDAPLFVEKAALEDSNPLIFNSEDMTFNQIKMGEELLQDETKSAWIVGYCTSKTEVDKENGEGTEPLEMEADFDAATGADEAVAGIANYEYYKYSNLAGENRLPLSGYPSTIAYCVYAASSSGIFTEINKVCFNESGGQPCGNVTITAAGGSYNPTGYGSTRLVYSTGWNPVCGSTSLHWKSGHTFSTVDKWVTAFKPYYSTLKSQLPNYLPVQSQDDTTAIDNQNGRIIYDSNEKKYYQVSVERLDNVWSETPIQAGNMYQTFLSAYNARANAYDSGTGHHAGDWQQDIMNGTTPNANTFAVRTYGAKYNITLTELVGYGGTGYSVKLSPNRYHLNDAPYDMFAIPYSDNLDIYKNGVKLFTANKLLAFQASMALVRKYQAAGYIYDLQLLPFCPVRGMIKAGPIFDIGDNVVDYITRKNSLGVTENIGVVIYASNSSDTFNIPYNITYENKKIAAMCDKYRLCSPNYNGQFEFNAAMNEGVAYFNVDFTYKPFNPYIHINPNFGGLYGQDFNDSRGLVCGGEFSLPAVANQWDTYELQNKNYQNIFDRQIQNMEVNNAVQREREIWNIAAGTLSAGVQGGATGAMVGGPWGAIAGAAIGTVSSLAGGIRDYQLNEKLRNEALDYTKDMFGYQLGNIQALPYTLTRTTAFTYNNKIFPIIEYYTCTDVEKDALAYKIAYNGMTVMTIGKIRDYIGNNWSYNNIDYKGYIKGRIIKLEDVNENNTIANAIADELYKGVFL